MNILADSVLDMQPVDFHNSVTGDYPSGRLTEDDSLFYDAPNAPHNHPPYTGDVFMNMDDIQFLLGADLEDIMAFFDATDDNLQYDFLDSSEKSESVNSATTVQSNSVTEVEGSSRLPGKATVSVPGTSVERDPSSLTRFIGPTNQLESVTEDNSAMPDKQVNGGWTLRKHAVDILSSISAPPAMAEGSVKGKVDGATVCRTLIQPNSFCSVDPDTRHKSNVRCRTMGSAEEQRHELHPVLWHGC